MHQAILLRCLSHISSAISHICSFLLMLLCTAFLIKYYIWYWLESIHKVVSTQVLARLSSFRKLRSVASLAFPSLYYTCIVILAYVYAWIVYNAKSTLHVERTNTRVKFFRIIIRRSTGRWYLNVSLKPRTNILFGQMVIILESSK